MLVVCFVELFQNDEGFDSVILRAPSAQEVHLIVVRASGAILSPEQHIRISMTMVTYY